MTFKLVNPNETINNNNNNTTSGEKKTSSTADKETNHQEKQSSRGKLIAQVKAEPIETGGPSRLKELDKIDIVQIKETNTSAAAKPSTLFSTDFNLEINNRLGYY